MAGGRGVRNDCERGMHNFGLECTTLRLLQRTVGTCARRLIRNDHNESTHYTLVLVPGCGSACGTMQLIVLCTWNYIGVIFCAKERKEFEYHPAAVVSP